MRLAVAGTPAPVVAKLQDASGEGKPVDKETFVGKISPASLQAVLCSVQMSSTKDTSEAAKELSVAEWLKPAARRSKKTECNLPCTNLSRPREIRTSCPAPQGSTNVASALNHRTCPTGIS